MTIAAGAKLGPYEILSPLGPDGLFLPLPAGEGLAPQQRSHWLTFLGVDPALDALRDDPRLGAMVSRVVPL